MPQINKQKNIFNQNIPRRTQVSGITDSPVGGILSGNKMNKGMYSSKTPEWETPQWLFDELNHEFNFALDVCATKKNAKCKKYYTKTDNGLMQNWDGNVWCNPPYGKEISQWVQQAVLQSHKGIIVMLLPARTDTKWFHDYLYKKYNVELRFIKGRLKFGDSKNSAPFPSMVAIIK